MMETLIKMNAPVQRLGQSMLLGVFMLMGSNMAFADNCENARNAYDDIYCTNKIFASADAELNKNYKLTKITKHAKRHFWLNDVCTCHGLLPSHSA